MDAGSVREDSTVLEANVGELKVFDGGNAFVTWYRLGVLNAARKDVEAEKSAVHVGGVKIVRHDVLNERAAAGAALDIDREGPGVREFAVFDADVANAAGGLTADADAGEDGIGHGAVGDQHVLGGSQQGVALHAAAALEGDAIVAGRDVAGVDAYVPAGIDINAVAVAARRADCKIPDDHVLAVSRMKTPHQAIVGGEVFEAKIVAVDWFNEGRVAQRVLSVGAAAQRGVADDSAGADDTGMSGIDSVDEGCAALDPLAFPAHLADGIIREIGSAENGRILVEAQERVGLEGQRIREVVTGWDQHLAAAENPTAIDGLLNGGGILGDAIASGAEIAHVEGELRSAGRGRLLGLRRAEIDQGSGQQTAPGGLQERSAGEIPMNHVAMVSLRAVRQGRMRAV